ncbi:hypothetical protein [Maribellus maritimus]|uniref:hypothetical protein n=1 Tax=Maribellus maritimus TaxID=2870838 RepID=UPI001EEAEFC9|nr:hypothetical protein [Maribellus maritimus]MCG6189702.1 hypothetical protein [Maribellus maritimus]
MKPKLVLILLLILPGSWAENINQVFAKKARQAQPQKIQGSNVHLNNLQVCMEQAWEVSWSMFFNDRTQQFYDYLSSYEKGQGLNHLPTSNEVDEQYPNYQGYDTGMEDCMISAGVMLCMIIDKYMVNNDNNLKNYAYAVFQGIKLSATVHGSPGFLARCVCVEDQKSIYINSSRDQYTHVVYGLWHYFHSPLCDDKTKKEIGEILSEIADRMKRNVTPENNYDFLRADGTHDTRGISKMWNVKGHEAARLPMIYAAAWNTTGNIEYFDLYREYIKPAINQSLKIEEGQPTYALLQMQSSIELLLSLEEDSTLKNKMGIIMESLVHMAEKRTVNANKRAQMLDLTMVGSDWRTGEGLNPKGEYRKVWYCIRESGEAALVQLMSQKSSFSKEQKELLSLAITRLDYEHVSSSGIFYLQGAYWRARRLGIL